jgi:hypothetical protein
MGNIFDKGSSAVFIMLCRLAYAFVLEASRRHPVRQDIVEAAVLYVMSSREARQRMAMGAAMGALEQRSPLVYRFLKQHQEVCF